MRIIDLTRQSMGWNNPFQTRQTNQIRNIGIHHSATTDGSQMIFENHWRRLGWRNGGYSEIILPNGDVEVCYVPTVVTNGVSGHNTHAYHICVVGNFRKNGVQPTVAQMGSLLERIRFNMNRFSISKSNVLGHNEFSGHGSTICSGLNMTNLRNQLRLPSVTPAPSQPASHAPHTHTVGSGETLSGIAKHHQTTVAELSRLNNLSNPHLIRAGQTLKLPSRSSSSPAIRVGSRVRVNQTARTWATGQNIASHVHGQTYTVQQIRNHSNELLLAGVMSWIRRSDVTVL